MCGGAGTRVWPESRESLPKQFISLVGPHSTFQMATEMLADGVFETPIVISNHDYRFLVAEQLQKIKREARIVLEPIRRDSGPAVAVAAELAAQSGPDTIVAVLAADHVVRDGEGFVALCKTAGGGGGARLYRDARHQAGRARHWLWLHQAGKDGNAGRRRVEGRGLCRK